MEIFLLGNELLHRKAEAVKHIGKEYIKIAEDLIQCLHKDKGIGLAGPQVGLMERIFAVHVEGDVPRIFINPSIIETSQEITKYEEGCLSIPGIYADVVRPQSVKVQAWNEKGKPFTLEASGLVARVILHEYDHLEGVLYIDHLPEQKRKKLLEKMEKAILRKNRRSRLDKEK